MGVTITKTTNSKVKFLFMKTDLGELALQQNVKHWKATRDKTN